MREFQLAAREALAVIEARGAAALLVGGTGLYLRSVTDDLHFPGRFPQCAAGLEEEIDAGGPPGSSGERAVMARLHGGPVRARPGRRGTDRADQPSSVGAGARGLDRLGPALLLLRAGTRALSADAGGAARARPRPRRARRADRGALRAPDGRRAPRRGPAAGAPPRGAVADRAPGARLPRAPLLTWRRGCRSGPRSPRRSAGPVRSHGASGRGSGVIPVSCGWNRRRIPCRWSRRISASRPIAARVGD